MKKFLSIVLFLMIASSMFSFEWGGIISDDTKIQSNLHSIEFHQSNNLSLWANFALSPKGSTYLITQGSVKYYWDISKTSNIFLPVINLDLFKFASSGRIGNVGTSFALGRFAFSDYTTKIFAQPCDGISLELAMPVVNMGFYAGYTGLLNSKEVSMLSNPEVEAKGTPAYIPVSYSVLFPSVIFNQRVGMQLLAFIDPSSAAYTRAYGTIMLKGPLAGPISYSFSTVFGTERFKNIMNLSDFYLYFIPNQNIQVSLGASYASGKLFFFSPFVGFTSYTAYNSSLSPQLSAVLMPSLSFSYVQKKLCSLLDLAAVFAMPEVKPEFKGVDGSVKIIFNIYSDLQLNFKVAGFYDLYDDSINETSIFFELSAALAF
ncbi:MAG: hypothetical protein IJ688_08775 [Treponema sp.]|nr:hypothetical protein [Treponema sp.]